MNDKLKQLIKSLGRDMSKLGKGSIKCFIISSLMLITACSSAFKPNDSLEMDPKLEQAVFITPEQAVGSLVQAITDDDKNRLKLILGLDYQEVLPLDGLKDKDVQRFLVAWDKSHDLIPQGDKKRLLAVGEADWTFPIPIVEGDAGWYFDIDEGLKRMLIRRIGRNELATMQAVLAYYDAQLEYAEQSHESSGILQYAQKFISSPGTHDGLYWPTQPDEEPSPLGTLMADRTPDGGYHGYYYHILTAQGEDAIGGAYNYIIGGKMRAGFALVAWPVEYGESGVMTFIVSHAGIVYQQDLGEDSAEIAKKMQIYNPGPGWIPTKEVSSIQEQKN